MKFIKFELLGILCLILLLIFTRRLVTSIGVNHWLEYLLTILFLANGTLILIVIPALILLSLRDNVAPKGVNHHNFRINFSLKYTVLSAILLSLNYISLFIFQNIVATTLLLITSCLTVLVFFLFSDKTRK